MRNLSAIIAGVLLGTGISNSYAATVVCGGTVDMLSYHANNQLMVKLSSMNNPVFFCDTEAVWTVPGAGYSTSPGACKALYSTFLSARVTGTPISNMYFDGDEVPTACNAWGSWKRANIRHYIY